MTERLADVTRRIGSVRQLAAVITAMRGIAAARSRAARHQLGGVRAHAAIIGAAIGRALALEAERAPRRGGMEAGGHMVIALCAEQGFAGVFSERVLEAAGRHVAAGEPGQGELMLVGDRGLVLARERGMAVAWSAPMIVHPGQAAALADRIAEALYARMAEGRTALVRLVHAVPGQGGGLAVEQRLLVPFDFGRFPASPSPVPPLLTMGVGRLLARLVEEYVFAELCEAVVLSLAAENEARMRAMIAARGNVTRTLDGLVGRARRLRQQEITSEIVELAAGSGLRQPGAGRI